jgi:predicted PurR-regulated permease PerM
VLLGVLAGGIGLALATPLTVVTLVLVRELYVEDVLSDRGG